MLSFREQIRSNSLALISLAVAFIALGYNTWRNETTESHRNVREASFRVLESLGELQEGNRIPAWFRGFLESNCFEITGYTPAKRAASPTQRRISLSTCWG